MSDDPHFVGEENVFFHVAPEEQKYAAVVPIDRKDYIDAAINRLLTQYRESPFLIGLIENIVQELDEAMIVTENIPSFFDLDTCVGHALTIVGKWLGWPRTHPKGARRAVFGFSKHCDDCYDGPPLAGWCTGVWDGCEGTEFTPWTIADDELYRRFLKSRIVQLFGDYRRDTLVAAASLLFEDSDCVIAKESPGVIRLSLGRPFRGEERATAHTYREVMPVAPGIKLQIRTQPENTKIFGFGQGWGGWCDSYWV